jgi:hypothetical protein
MVADSICFFCHLRCGYRDEVKLCEQICAGHSIGSVAKRFGIAPKTARSIFARRRVNKKMRMQLIERGWAGGKTSRRLIEHGLTSILAGQFPLEIQSVVDTFAQASLEIESLHDGLRLRIPIQIDGNRGIPLRAEHKRPANTARFLLSSKVQRPIDVLATPSQNL